MKQSNSIEFLKGLASKAKERTVNTDATRIALYKVAFDALCNPQDWKLPVNALVTVHTDSRTDLGLFEDAIEFYTGTKPLILVEKDELDKNLRQVTTFRLIAAGYYLQD